MREDNHYLQIIVKFLKKASSAQEEEELENWILRSERNLNLFEDLTNEHNSKWAEQFFISSGVDCSNIRWKKRTGWYNQDYDTETNVIVIALVGIAMLILLIIYFLAF